MSQVTNNNIKNGNGHIGLSGKRVPALNRKRELIINSGFLKEKGFARTAEILSVIRESLVEKGILSLKQIDGVMDKGVITLSNGYRFPIYSYKVGEKSVISINKSDIKLLEQYIREVLPEYEDYKVEKFSPSSKTPITLKSFAEEFNLGRKDTKRIVTLFRDAIKNGEVIDKNTKRIRISSDPSQPDLILVVRRQKNYNYRCYFFDKSEKNKIKKYFRIRSSTIERIKSGETIFSYHKIHKTVHLSQGNVEVLKAVKKQVFAQISKELYEDPDKIDFTFQIPTTSGSEFINVHLRQVLSRRIFTLDKESLNKLLGIIFENNVVNDVPGLNLNNEHFLFFSLLKKTNSKLSENVLINLTRKINLLFGDNNHIEVQYNDRDTVTLFYRQQAGKKHIAFLKKDLKKIPAMLDCIRRGGHKTFTIPAIKEDEVPLNVGTMMKYFKIERYQAEDRLDFLYKLIRKHISPGVFDVEHSLMLPNNFYTKIPFGKRVNQYGFPCFSLKKDSILNLQFFFGDIDEEKFLNSSNQIEQIEKDKKIVKSLSIQAREILKAETFFNFIDLPSNNQFDLKRVENIFEEELIAHQGGISTTFPYQYGKYHISGTLLGYFTVWGFIGFDENLIPLVKCKIGSGSIKDIQSERDELCLLQDMSVKILENKLETNVFVKQDINFESIPQSFSRLVNKRGDALLLTSLADNTIAIHLSHPGKPFRLLNILSYPDKYELKVRGILSRILALNDMEALFVYSSGDILYMPLIDDIKKEDVKFLRHGDVRIIGVSNLSSDSFSIISSHGEVTNYTFKKDDVSLQENYSFYSELISNTTKINRLFLRGKRCYAYLSDMYGLQTDILRISLGDDIW